MVEFFHPEAYNILLASLRRLLWFNLATLSCCLAWGQFTLRTAAGGGPIGIPGVGANSNFPEHLAFWNGALYIADAGENRIFKLDQTGTLRVVAGSGWSDQNAPTGDGGPAINANLIKPAAVAVDTAGTVYLVDGFGIRKVDGTGTITTLAGTGCLNYDSNDDPMPIALNPAGTVLYCVTTSSPSGAVVSQVNLSTLAVTPFAGGGTSTADNVAPTMERLWTVNGLAVDASGNVYISSWGSNEVYKVSGGLIVHIAGGGTSAPNNVLATSASLSDPLDVAVDSGNNVFFSMYNSIIYRVDASTQIITEFAGGGSCPNAPYINDGRPALSACLSVAIGLTIDRSTNNLYVSDSDALATTFVDERDQTNHLVRMISAAPPNVIQTVVGNVFPASLPLGSGQTGGFEFLSGDGYAATDARLAPVTQGLAVDPSGNLFIGDYWNYTVRRVDAVTGIITSITPNPGSTLSIAPFFLAAGPNGTVYANTAAPGGSGNPATIWSISGGALTAVASFTGSQCTYTPDGALASSGCIGNPQGITLDGAGNMYVADNKFCTIRQISPGGVLSTVTGTSGTCTSSGDNGTAARATVGGPSLVASDSAGNIWLADYGANNYNPTWTSFVIRKISANRSLITTVWTPPQDSTELQSLTVDANGNGLAQIYSPSVWGGICGASGYCIIQISATNNSVTMIAGGGNPGLPSLDGVNAMGATLGCEGVLPTLLGGMAVNASNQIYFTEGCSGFSWAGSYSSLLSSSNSVVRRLDPTPGPPSVPVLTAPANGATGVAVTPTLTWSTATGATSYDVYFGTSSTPPMVTNVTTTSYAPATLSNGTTYYWHIEARNNVGTTDSGAPWSFTTIVAAPAPPTLASPANGATGVSLAPTLTWNASTGATSYNVYFGTSATPPLVNNAITTSYSPGTLTAGVTYYWQIVAMNAGGTGSSSVWSFTTQPPSGIHAIPNVDFNGDGKQDVFLYDPVAGTGYAGLSNGLGAFTYVYNGFTPGFDTIRYGNFNSSGLSGLVAYNSSSTLGYTLLGTGTGTFTPVSLFWGPGFTKVAAGDLNGDGFTDFVIYRPSDGTSYTVISNGDGTFHYQYALVSIGFTNMVVADFNGDGKADVFFYRSSDGLAFLGISNGTGGFTFSPVTAGLGYGFVESGDINGDGKADLLFYASGSGAAQVGLSTGSGFTFTPYSYSAGFTIVKLFDFNGDGKADVALYNMNNTLGYLGVGSGTGSFTFSSLFWGAGMTTADALDLNGDGKIDLAIYNSANGASYTAISSGNAASPFTYQYAYWGNGKLLATAAAQP